MTTPKTTPPAAAEDSRPLFLIVAAGVFMSTLDSSMVNVALPFIMREFHSTLTLTQWVVMVYLLTISATILFWGHVADRLGRGHIYSLGMLAFGCASFFGSIAPTIAWLILCRFCQAVGAAMMMANGPAIIKENFDPARLGRYLGMIGVAVSLGLMTGPTLGGFLIEYYSWRSIFFVTAPVSILFFLAARFILTGPEQKNPHRLDLAGSLLWILSISLFIGSVSRLSSGETIFIPFILYTLSLAVLFLFVRHESAAPEPLLPLGLFKEKFFSIAMFCALTSFAVLFSVILLMPFYLHTISKLAPLHIGLVMLAIPAAVLVISPVAGWFADHFGDRFPATFGLLVSSASLAWLGAGITAEMSPLAVAMRLAVLGFGQAMFLSPNSASALARVHNDRAGITSGLLATARNLGMLLGVAFAGMVFSWIFSIETGGMDLKDFRPGDARAFIIAFRITLLGSAAVGLCSAIVSALRDQGKKRA